MIFSHLLKTATVNTNKLIEYGFSKKSEGYALRKTLAADGFYVDFVLNDVDFFAEVYESGEFGDDEKYALVNVNSACGKFVTGIREEVKSIVEDIRFKCFEEKDIRRQYVNFIEKEFGVIGDNPFSDDSLDTVVFRTPQKSWFAIIMKIKYKNFGMNSDDELYVVNLKHNPLTISTLINNDTIFNAWHMNKKHWITVVLSARTDFEQLKQFTKESYGLVCGKKKN